MGRHDPFDSVIVQREFDSAVPNKLKPIEPNPEELKIGLERMLSGIHKARRRFTHYNYQETILIAYGAVQDCLRAVMYSKGFIPTNFFSYELGLKQFLIVPGFLGPGHSRALRDMKDTKDDVYSQLKKVDEDFALQFLLSAQVYIRTILGAMKFEGFGPDVIPTGRPVRDSEIAEEESAPPQVVAKPSEPQAPEDPPMPEDHRGRNFREIQRQDRWQRH